MSEAPELDLTPEEHVTDRMVQEDDQPAPPSPAAATPTPTPAPVEPQSYFDLPPEARAALWTPDAVAQLMARLSGPPPRTRWHLERPP